ncbi:lipopolysaccharide biosynthesis protein [Siculibacillus lacustris]|uniref:Lipopolysaccharide biosynthesis protein n=1 Tax=Siculibacillus lacustris TaxID=1549641 RepID=A0A4V2KSV1_9HYPH|nr:lipopolysaccharide biosynthesis protein [Siculibacillus lacustris]TBW34526.1 lipopolysaccharide biosynthesis protein [Siculibacillus lacustris]
MSIVRSLIGYAPAVVLPRLVSLLLVVVLTRLISRNEYGLYVLVTTIGEAVDAICSNWVRIALARFASGQAGAIGAESLRSLKIHAATLALSAAVAVGLTAAMQVERPVEFAVAVIVYMVATAVLRFPSTILSVQGDRNGIVAVEVGKALGVLVFGVAVTWLSGSFFVQTLVFAVVTTAAGAWGWRRSWRGIAARVGTAEPLRGFLGYGLPIVPAAIVTSVLASSDRLWLNHSDGAAAVALYAAGVMLAKQPMDFLFSLAGVRVFPLLMEDYERGGPEVAGRRLSELISGVGFITLPAAAGVVLVAEPMAGLLLAHDYVDAAVVVLPLAVATALFAGFKTFVLDQIFHMVKRNGLNATISLPAALVGLAALMLLVPRWGIWGCALAYLIQFAFLFATTFVVTRRLMPFPIPWGDLGRIVAATAVMSAAVWAVRPLTAGTGVLVQLGVGVVVGIVVYGAAALVIRPSAVAEFLPRR